VGTLEAFHTGGGISTLPFAYKGKIDVMEYKTLRYPGHAEIMQAIRELGMLELDPVDVDGIKVIPREVFIATAGPRLRKPDSPDLVALRVTVEGKRNGRDTRLGWELLDYFDREHGISAMMRTTGYSLAITGQMQARGEIRGAGVLTPDEAVDAERYIGELGKRGIEIKELGTRR
jgi:lysine 6-dehydrogenase